MTDDLCAALRQFSPGTLCTAHARVRVLDPGIRPLFQGAALSGTAVTAMTPPGQNAAIHRAVYSAKPGDILVVDGGGCISFGLFGDILAEASIKRGIRGVVIDAAVRDAAGIRDLRFPVFCRAVNATGSGKSDPGTVNTAIVCGGVPVRPGDVIVGGDDGVAVIPRENGAQVLREAEAVERREGEIRKRIENGDSTCEIFGISP